MTVVVTVMGLVAVWLLFGVAFAALWARGKGGDR